ncbi:MAG: RdgB/HAM1 family non-canonical purine NTP pyrophosphatase [Acidiferrobacterales bacterium]
MKAVVLASNNASKLREIAALLAPLDFTVVPQSQINVPGHEETSISFIENAILKARHASEHTGMPAIADDSGLEVDALGGAPGVHSARYAGAGSTDQANTDKLLSALADIPAERRTARFVCLIAYLRHANDPTPIVCQGTWEGRVLPAPRGERGFGYDPVFFVPTHGCSAAELPSEVKNRLSHRGQALRKLVQQLGTHKN